MKTKLFLLILSFILFFIGIYLYGSLQEIFISSFKNIQFLHRDINKFQQSLWFGLSISIIPFFYGILQTKGKISNFKSIIIVFSVFLISIIGAVILKNVQIKYAAKNSYTPLNGKTIFDYPAENLNYSLFIIIFEFIAFIVLMIFLKKRKNNCR